MILITARKVKHLLRDREQRTSNTEAPVIFLYQQILTGNAHKPSHLPKLARTKQPNSQFNATFK